jgi:hypothetical protein
MLSGRSVNFKSQNNAEAIGVPTIAGASPHVEVFRMPGADFKKSPRYAK